MRIEVLVTSPGRQAENGDELLERLAMSARVQVRLLSADEEGRLAFLGAVEKAEVEPGRIVAVCDVGGGSAQITVGTLDGGAAWTRSIDIGSMRLTSRLLPERSSGRARSFGSTRGSRDAISRTSSRRSPIWPSQSVAAPARFVRSSALISERESWRRQSGFWRTTPTSELIGHHDLNPARVHTLAAGAIILAAIQERLGVPLRVVRGGIREGAALELRSELAAA